MTLVHGSLSFEHRRVNQRHPTNMPRQDEISIFDEQYRVVAVEANKLSIRGVLSGNVLTIINPEPETFLSQKDYPLGKLISLTDPSATTLN